jgi:hypothetical protein
VNVVDELPPALMAELGDAGFAPLFAQMGRSGGWRRGVVRAGGTDGDEDHDNDDRDSGGEKKDPCSWQRKVSLTNVLRRLGAEFLDEMVPAFSVEVRLPAWPIPLLAGLGPSISVTHGDDKSLAVQGAFGLHAGSAVKVGSASSSLGVPIWSGRGEVPPRGLEFKGSATVGLGPAISVDAYSSPGSATVEVTGGVGANAFVGAAVTAYVLESAETDPCR